MSTTIETDSALWDLALAKTEEIELAHRGQFRLRSRSAGMWTQNPSISVTMHLTLASAEGEVLLYVVTACAGRPHLYSGRQEPSTKFECFHAFDSDYWLQQVDSDPAARVVVGGTHYRLGPNRPGNNDLKGFAGRRWEIEYLDGRPSVVTNDLWYQGKIPEQYRSLIPDNARFVL